MSDILRVSWIGAVVCASFCAAPALAASGDLTSLSLDQLMNEPVTSVSKKATKLIAAAAAISVVTQEDFKRLGITSIPDALRLVPGMDVAQISSDVWAVSSRGFNTQYATKLLVLIDGRSVYTPATAGVSWNAQDLMLEDIDRIEVIRGPGATLWGANAVNGVINIVTKRTVDTQGTLISQLNGSESTLQSAARFGATIGPDAYFRVYAKYLDQGSFIDSNHAIDTGGWHTARGGFRIDWAASGTDDLTLQGDVYGGHAQVIVSELSLAPPSATNSTINDADSGANLLERWTHYFSQDSVLSLQTYVDHVTQGDGFEIEHRNTYDIDLQHRFGWRVNDVVWGAGYRASSINEASQTFDIIWPPSLADIRLFNLFIQDEVTVIPDRLVATLGSKFEHSSIAGWNPQPEFRLSLTPTPRQTFWSAVSRSVRTPSIYELYGRTNLFAAATGPNTPPVLGSILPNSHLKPESLTAFELGYRFNPSSTVSFEINGFVNDYRNLILQEPGAPSFESIPGPPHLLIPTVYQNTAAARSYGTEAAARWQALEHWQLDAGYSFLRMKVPAYRASEDQSPRHQVQLRSYVDLPRHWQFNAALYYVDTVSHFPALFNQSIPAYFRGDLGLVWKGDGNLSIGIWGLNLFQHEHPELGGQTSYLLTEIPRSVNGKVTWSF